MLKDMNNDVNNKSLYNTWKNRWAVVLTILTALAFVAIGLTFVYLFEMLEDAQDNDLDDDLFDDDYILFAGTLFLSVTSIIVVPILMHRYFFSSAYLTFSKGEMYVWKTKGSVAVTKDEIVSHNFKPFSLRRTAHYVFLLQDGTKIISAYPSKKMRRGYNDFFYPGLGDLVNDPKKSVRPIK